MAHKKLLDLMFIQLITIIICSHFVLSEKYVLDSPKKKKTCAWMNITSILYSYMDKEMEAIKIMS